MGEDRHAVTTWKNIVEIVIPEGLDSQVRDILNCQTAEIYLSRYPNAVKGRVPIITYTNPPMAINIRSDLLCYFDRTASWERIEEITGYAVKRD